MGNPGFVATGNQDFAPWVTVGSYGFAARIAMDNPKALLRELPQATKVLL